MTRLFLTRTPFRAPWLPPHEGCTTQGQVVNVIASAEDEVLVQAVMGNMDRPCVRAMAKELRKGGENPFGLGVLCPLGHMPVRVRRAEGTSFVIPRGAYAVINPKEDVLPDPDAPRGLALVEILLFQPVLRECREAVGIPRSLGPFDFDPAPRPLTGDVQRAISAYREFLKRPPDVEEDVWLAVDLRAAAWRLLTALWKHHPSGLALRLKRLGYRGSLDRRLFEAVEFIRGHLREPLTNDQLARHAGTSVPNLYRLFRETFHSSPRAFIRRLRVDQAALLIKRSPRPVLKDIAHDVGLGSSWALTRSFRLVRGHAPT